MKGSYMLPPHPSASASRFQHQHLKHASANPTALNPEMKQSDEL